MELVEYQERTERTAIYPNDGHVAGVPAGVIYTASGVAGEAGEISDKLKKAMREDEEEYLAAMESELGDLLWYVARLADELGLDLDAVAAANLEKLRDRQQRDTLTGAGDDR